MKKNLITVLKKLLAAFGGEDTNSNNAVEIVDKIAHAANGVTEKELPEVTASDNGKVLSVIDGAWNKADAPSGGVEPLIVTETNNTLNKNWDTINRTLGNGITCIITNSPYTQNRVVVNTYYKYDDGAYTYYVVGFDSGVLTKWTTYDINKKPIRMT